MKTQKLLFSLLVGGFSSSLLFYNFNSSNKMSLNHKLYKTQSLALRSNLAPNYTPITQAQLDAARTSLNAILSTGSFAQDFNTQVANRTQNSHTFNIQTLAYNALLRLNPIYAQINVQFEIAAAQAPSLDWTNQFSYNAANRQLTFTRPDIFKYGLASALNNQKITFNVILSAQALTSRTATGTLVMGPFQGLLAMPTSSIPNTDGLTDTISTKYGFLSLYSKSGTAQTKLAFQRKGNVGTIQTVSIGSFYVGAGTSTTKTAFTNDVPFVYLSATNDYIIATAQGNSTVHSTYDVNVFYFKISELQNKTAATFKINAQVLNPKDSTGSASGIWHLGVTLTKNGLSSTNGLSYEPIPISDNDGNLEGLAILKKYKFGPNSLSILMSKMETFTGTSNKYLSIMRNSDTSGTYQDGSFILDGPNSQGIDLGIDPTRLANYANTNKLPGRFMYVSDPQTGQASTIKWGFIITAGSQGTNNTLYYNNGTFLKDNQPSISGKYSYLKEVKPDYSTFNLNSTINDRQSQNDLKNSNLNWEDSLTQVGGIITGFSTSTGASPELYQNTLSWQKFVETGTVTRFIYTRKKISPSAPIKVTTTGRPIYLNLTYGVTNFLSNQTYAILYDSNSSKIIRLNYNLTYATAKASKEVFSTTASDLNYQYLLSDVWTVNFTGQLNGQFNFIPETINNQFIITDAFAYYKTGNTFNYFYH